MSHTTESILQLIRDAQHKLATPANRHALHAAVQSVIDERDVLRTMLQRITDRAVPAGWDSCNLHMVKLRAVLIDDARAALARTR